MISLLKVPRYYQAQAVYYSTFIQYLNPRVEHNSMITLYLENHQLLFLIILGKISFKAITWARLSFVQSIVVEWKKLFTEEKRERDCCSLTKNLIFSLSLSFFPPKLLPFKSNVNFICTTQIVSTERKKILNQIRSLHFILFAMEYFESEHLNCSGAG